MPRHLPKFFGFLLGLLAAYAWWLEPSRLHLTRHTVADPDRRLPVPVRVLLLTDWHLGRFSRPAGLQAKMARLRREHAARPFDLVLLGGDYIDEDPKYLRLLEPCLRMLNNFEVPIYAVLGNHDYYAGGGDIQAVTVFLEGAGVSVLKNQAATVTVHGQRIFVVGLDDLQESRVYYDPEIYQTPAQYKVAAGKLDWYADFDDAEPETPRLLLCHNPDAVYVPGRTPLAVLCGHTHGGQMMLLDWVSRPLHRWIHPHLPPGSAVTWAGRKQANGRTLIVSRGIEGSAVPIRLLRPPEAVVITLH